MSARQFVLLLRESEPDRPLYLHPTSRVSTAPGLTFGVLYPRVTEFPSLARVWTTSQGAARRRALPPRRGRPHRRRSALMAIEITGTVQGIVLPPEHPTRTGRQS